jgi:hypothetical protein
MCFYLSEVRCNKKEEVVVGGKLPKGSISTSFSVVAKTKTFAGIPDVLMLSGWIPFGTKKVKVKITSCFMAARMFALINFKFKTAFHGHEAPIWHWQDEPESAIKSV